MMSDESAPKRRFVSCPKCRQLLQEPPGCDLYKCGECGTTLQAKKQKGRDLNTESSTQETGAASSSSEEFSLDGASEFTEPPYIGGWRGLVRIELVDNKICELPQSPEFPKLKVLLLQGNVDLMDIPDSFFNHTPLLQHLDLSNTSIRDLPPSISKLTELITFYLRSCDLFLELPPQIGQLKKLVVLDLDGTLITHLPIEVRELINLQRLILCFDGGCHDNQISSSTIIPPGVISNLTLLKYLSINVDPEDDRWNENNVANILVEISGLMRLETACIHVPEAKLLELIPARESLNFRLVVGHYKRRFISRVTPELEQKFKCYDHYIKFVNGIDIPNGVKMNLERCKALYLDRHVTIKSLADFELMSLHSLEECILAECNEMETIVDGRASYSYYRPALPRLESLAVFYMKNLRSICERPLQMNTTSFLLCSLKSMSLHTCPMLTTIFSISFIENLSLLEELIVEDCPKVTTLISHDSSKHETNIFLPRLRKIWLLYLPELINIFNGLLHVGQSLQVMGFYYCPKLQSLSKTELSSQDLRVIKGESRWWETLKWNEAEWGDAGQPNFLKLIFSPINVESDIMVQLAAHHDVDEDQLRREREIFDFFLYHPPSTGIVSDQEISMFEFEEPTNECSNSMASQTKHSKIQAKTMEEVLNSAKHAWELAQYLGPKLANMANQPSMLLMSIDEVVKAFGVAKERLSLMISQQQGQTITPSSFASMLPHDDTQISATSGSSMQDLMRSGSYAHTMDQFFLMQHQYLLENKNMVSVGGGDVQEFRYRGTLKIGEMGVKDVEGSDRSKGSEGEMQGMEASPSRSRKSRKNDLKKRIILVPAPQVGNTEMPPDDGFTWRKYGQKEILGTKYPRAYYRCTHQKLYLCPATKQVQRLDDNPNIFEVTYRGEHTCHMSSTAPSSFPPSQLLVDISKDNMTQTQSTNTMSPQLSPSPTSASTWLSRANLSLHGGGSGGGSSSGGGGAGPSTSKYGTENYLVADMADAMFNSGSSSGNSMESLFPLNEDKWEAGEKKS